MIKTCVNCDLPIQQANDGTWSVFGTDTTADGLSFCPPDPDVEPEGSHEPRCSFGWCILSEHADSTHVDATGYSWTDDE